MKILSRLFTLCGIVLIIGTAGASDTGSIDLFQTIIQALTGIILIFDGMFINNILRGAKEKWKSVNNHI